MNYIPKTPFQPSLPFRHAHFQTIYTGLLRENPRLKTVRYRLETADQDFIDVDVMEQDASKPYVLLLHGLSSSGQAAYVRTTMQKIKEMGWNVAAMNYRGCSGELNRSQTTYHSGKTDDLSCVYDWLLSHKQVTEVYMVGFSIGGNILLKWLGEEGARLQDRVKKAVAVSVPYDLAQSVKLLDSGLTKWVYTKNLLRALKGKTVLKEKQHPGLVDLEVLKRCHTFDAFDGHVTAPLNGFKDARDYWHQSSSKHYLEHVQVEALLIHAADDPFFYGKFLPHEEIDKNPYLHLLHLPFGGHLGFAEGFGIGNWLENEIISYFTK